MPPLLSKGSLSELFTQNYSSWKSADCSLHHPYFSHSAQIEPPRRLPSPLSPYSSLAPSLFLTLGDFFLPPPTYGVRSYIRSASGIVLPAAQDLFPEFIAWAGASRIIHREAFEGGGLGLFPIKPMPGMVSPLTLVSKC